MEGSWEGIAGCVVCMESVYVVGGCNIVAREGMFCCSWLRSILSSNRMLYYEKADVSTALHRSIHSMHKTLLCMLCMMKTAELAVETSAFFQ